MGDDDEIKSWKAWTMEMPMNNSNILMMTMSGPEQASRDYKKFLYAKTTHSKHAIEYHMQQIMERQMVVNEYRSMMVDRMDLTPLESNSYKSDLVVISHIIHMIEVESFWQRSSPTSRKPAMKKSMNKKTSLCTVQKMTKPMESWMRKKLSTIAVKVGLQ